MTEMFLMVKLPERRGETLMAFQHLSAANGRVIASTPSFGAVTEDELAAYINCSAGDSGGEPIRFCHFYKESIGSFVQICVSLIHSRSGQSLPVAHTLALSDAETRFLLNEHVSPFSPAMFMNSKETFERPKTSVLEPVEYRFLKCGDREHNSALISKFFRSDVFARFILAVLQAPASGHPVYVALPGGARETSLNAVRLMNAVIPALPAVYRKRLGFMTCVTEPMKCEGISVCFTSGVDLASIPGDKLYCFDVSGGDAIVKGADPADVKAHLDLIRAVMGNILSFDQPSLVGFFDDVLEDSPDGIGISALEKAFGLWRTVSGAGSKAPDAATISSLYELAGNSENKAAFQNLINGFWERETEKCKAGGYSTGIEMFDAVNRLYPDLDDEERRRMQRTWSFILIYTLQNGNTALYDGIFSPQYESSELVKAVSGYVIYLYIGFLSRGDKTSAMSAACGKVTEGYIKKAADGDSEKLFALLGRIIQIVSRYYAEMGLSKSREYDVFSSGLLVYFDEPVAKALNVKDLFARFSMLRVLNESISGKGALGKTVFDHFYRSVFVPGFSEELTSEYVEGIVKDRKKMFDLSKLIDNYPELGNLENVSLYQRLCDIIIGKRDLSILFSLEEYVNKPELQKRLVNWIRVYNLEYPEFILSILANMSCSIGDGGNMTYEIDYTAAYTMFFEATDHDREQMLRELNRFIPEAEAAILKPDYKKLGLAAFREPTAVFVNENFFAKSIDRKTVKDNENLLKRFDKVKAIRAYADPKKNKRFGK